MHQEDKNERCKKVDNMDAKQEELNSLYRLLYEREKKFEQAKITRSILTIIGFSVLYFLIFWHASSPSELSDFLRILIASIFIAGFHFWLNALVFSYLFSKGRNESETLAAIKKKIDDLEKTL